MHAAPPVRMNVGPEPRWRGFVCATAGAAAANVGAWVAAAAELPPLGLAAIALASAVVCGLVAKRAQRHAAVGELSWDGTLWHWVPKSAAASDPSGNAGELWVMMDLGHWVLLCFRLASTARAVWLPVSREQAGGSWSHWRAAMFGPRPTVDAAADPR